VSGSQLLLLGGTPQVVSDPNFEYTTLLLPGNGTNGAQNNTFLDSSTNNFTITRNGNTTQGTFSPFSQTGWGNYFNGSSYISAADNAALDLGTGDFTIEGWVYIADGIADNAGIVSKRNASAFNAGDYRVSYRTGTSKISFANDAVNERNTPVVQKNSWTHFAIVRASGTLSAYANGVRGDTVADSVDLTNGEIQTIGVNATLFFTGYMSNIRIVKGTAVYSGATYTVPTAPLTAITNTSLLTCQSNRFVDNSSNAFAITRNGDVSVQAFSPFNPTAAWSAATYGGSGYFDGSGDYLSVASNSAFDIGSSDFTIECWFNANSFASAFGLISRYDGTPAGWVLRVISATTIRFVRGADVVLDSTTTMATGSWNHVAVVRSGSTLSVYHNGTRINQITGISNFADATSALQIGRTNTITDDINGYISSARVVKGTAVYSGTTYTVPTAPLTAITNTSLLLNYTNAGIYDATSKNNLETVGNAQISTTQSKFGGSSMYFDGNGDYLKGSQPSILQDIAGGDFTIEFWVYFDSVAGDRALVSKYGNAAESAGDLGYVVQWVQSTNVLRLVLGKGSGSGDALYTWSWTPSTGVWYHVAVTRSGTSGRAFINGTQIGTTSTLITNDVVSPNSIQVGKTHTTAQYMNGYIDDLRITKGVARYTANFTAPTAAFPLL
jgi:hypothetical protein